MSYTLGGSIADVISEQAAARKKYEEEYAKTHAGVKPPPEVVEQYMKEHPEIYKPGVLEQTSSFVKFAAIGVAAILFAPIVIGLIKKKKK